MRVRPCIFVFQAYGERSSCSLNPYLRNPHKVVKAFAIIKLESWLRVAEFRDL